jgi:hypothetical protein
MIRVALKLVAAAAAVWAIWSFVPVGERTLAARWRAAGSLSAFLERGWAEAVRDTATRSSSKPQARPKPTPPAARPTEGHTDADRRAVERILADRVDATRP